MAVQAQYPTDSYAFPQHFQYIRSTNNGFKEEQIGDPNSDLACNAYGSRKRNRDSDAVVFQKFPIPPKIQPIPPLKSQHLMEIDALIGLHKANVRSGLDEIQKKHCREFVQIFQNQAAKKITEKDAEIESLRRRQAELEARLKQMTAENQIWFTVANNSEALVTGLKANLDQVLRQNAVNGECHVASSQAEDAESCCYGSEDRKGRGLCMVCGERGVSVLVVPCRHLCLCLECEQVSDTCPICCGPKNVGLQVFME